MLFYNLLKILYNCLLTSFVVGVVVAAVEPSVTKEKSYFGITVLA
jgi:hypothetical protein